MVIANRANRWIALAGLVLTAPGCAGGGPGAAPDAVVEVGAGLAGAESSWGPPAGPPRIQSSAAKSERPSIRWRRSRSLGSPWNGRLLNGVRLPVEGTFFFTWNPARRESPNRAYRRYGTDRLVRVTLQVLRTFANAHPGAPRVGIGDLSRRHGGDFGRQFGGLGHSSHQNGLDVDIYYPRRDEREVEARRPHLIDRVLAQDLVDRFVRAGAEYVFVGPNTGITGPPAIVQALAHHDNHMHVRIPTKALIISSNNDSGRLAQLRTR